MKRLFYFLILGSFVYMLIGGSGTAQISSLSLAVAKVTAIVDGDTIDVEYISGGQNLPTRVQLYLIDAPENVAGGPFVPANVECYGPEAMAFASEYLLGKTVWLRHQNRITEASFVERVHALVYLDSDEQSLFQAIALSQGMAQADVRFSEEQSLYPRSIKLSVEAKDSDRGIWGECQLNLQQNR